MRLHRSNAVALSALAAILAASLVCPPSSAQEQAPPIHAPAWPNDFLQAYKYAFHACLSTGSLSALSQTAGLREGLRLAPVGFAELQSAALSYHQSLLNIQN